MTRVVSISARDRTLTELDWIRIRRCIRHSEPDCAPYAPLDDVLEGAAIVPVHRVGADVVTMYSQLLLRLLPDGGAELLDVDTLEGRRIVHDEARN